MDLAGIFESVYLLIIRQNIKLGECGKSLWGGNFVTLQAFFALYKVI